MSDETREWRTFADVVPEVGQEIAVRWHDELNGPFMANVTYEPDPTGWHGCLRESLGFFDTSYEPEDGAQWRPAEVADV